MSSCFEFSTGSSTSSSALAALSFTLFSVIAPSLLLLRLGRKSTTKLYDETRTLLALGPLYDHCRQDSQFFSGLLFLSITRVSSSSSEPMVTLSCFPCSKVAGCATRRWDIAQISPSKIPGRFPYPYEYPSMLNWCLCLCALSARTARVLLQGTRQWFVIMLMSLTIQNTSTVVYPTCLKQTINRFT
jgi:hypothetical protein